MAQEPSTAPENEADVAQENVGRDNMQGQGEWPDPDTPPRGPAGGDREGGGEEPGGEPPAHNFKEVLEADPVLGGSSTGMGSQDSSAEED